MAVTKRSQVAKTIRTRQVRLANAMWPAAGFKKYGRTHHSFLLYTQWVMGQSGKGRMRHVLIG